MPQAKPDGVDDSILPSPNIIKLMINKKISNCSEKETHTMKIIEIIGTNDLAAKASKRKIKQLGIKTSQEKLKMAKDAANEKVTKAKNALQKAQKPDPVN